uniref:RWD domain-containing protein 2A n=1 Tax=Cacopsylla melanoneura TaxID=428564 RepID=A0A8D8ZPI5_9HEMI
MDEPDEDNIEHSFTIEECLELQLQEIEMLQSMFANPGEFTMFDETMINNVQKFIDCSPGEKHELPNHLDFTITLTRDRKKLSICIHLPHGYPCTEPEVFVRSDQLNRKQETDFNSELNKMVVDHERNVICLYTVIDWIQDQIDRFCTEDTNKKTSDQQSTPKDLKKYETFTRYWIYSHHIYSKIKRKTMLDLSADLNITGFVLPGKPGIICIEGTSLDCEDWWYRIRNMTWKRILCKKVEEINLEATNESADDIINVFDTHRKFEGFKEIAFYNSKSNMKQDYHMDMGEFFKFLTEKQCAYMFKEYFGFEGKS